jgi:predicted short-subunit dehydrogenase-like oxidoreductase (DUF2520 family)
VGIIGAGKVGSTLARLWHQKGFEIAAVFSRTPANAQRLAAQVGAEAIHERDNIFKLADLTVLAVPDDAIEVVVAAIRSRDLSGKAVIHTSGAHSAADLAPLAERGALTGSLHPAFPFADIESAMRLLPGATFAVEADSEPLRGWLEGLVLALDGQLLAIPPGGKAVYHAALVIASNYTVTLYSLAEGLLVSLGADRAVADRALDTLLLATVDNLRREGVPEALTGPLIRSDVGTIGAHLDALRRVDERLVEVYVQLARLSYSMLLARNVSPNTVERLFRESL